ncbi:glycosyltransferase [Flavivirga eckloniae]|uniref:Glycosyl transferase family 2 n=1 Tax=Flavivirga eckloniae TaxID=1803846 RepID=A0A2K9PP69_9FLAO|nr:glycosyltransferase [Flavivirga eckloniae]AUP78377.1 glycosyl transferase family 2 [Flavivirga eckloniae]
MVFLDFIFYAFIVVVAIQIIFYTFFFSRFAFLKQAKKYKKNISVSVLICAKNEAENLQNFLPLVINQDYPDFEIVLINDASNDNTLQVMEQFASKHKNIKIVNVKNTEAFWANKKYALTLGIKASKHEYLLFTDADCKPASKHWIKHMTAHFSDKKHLVLGYGGYVKIKNSFLNKLVRFETLVTAIHYFSFAKLGLPYMGVGRNLAYTKTKFFKANGFVDHMKLPSGDDDLFINQVANKKNTSICVTTNSFTESIPKTSFRSWFKQKRRHVSTAKFYKLKHKILLTLIYSSQLLFWGLAILLFSIPYNWEIVLALVLFRMIFQYVIYNKSAKKLREKDLLVLLPFLEVFLIIVQLTIFINNLISKPNYWK